MARLTQDVLQTGC